MLLFPYATVLRYSAGRYGELKMDNVSVESSSYRPLANPSGVETQSKTLERLDQIGTIISSACAIHCLAMPLVLTMLPFLGLGFLAHGAFDIVMIGVAMSLALMSLCWGYRIHKSLKTFLFLIAAATFFYVGHEFEGNHLHWLLMTLGGFSLAGGHLLNRKLCKSCRDCCTHP